jgi:hypothetical protein
VKLVGIGKDDRLAKGLIVDDDDLDGQAAG